MPVGKVLVLADVHSNLRALRAVLDDAASRGGFDGIWLLGDSVGYGPEPNECIDLLRQHPLTAVAGNHDFGVLESSVLTRFNAQAAEACRLNAQLLSESSRLFLRGLLQTQCMPPFFLVHGSPRDPLWEYVVDAARATLSSASCPQEYCLVGHTHCPAYFHGAPDAAGSHQRPVEDDAVVLEARAVINPGSVGQPRDGDPRASYLLLDLSRRVATFHRVPYDVEGTIDAMRRVGLPEPLARRLHAGY